MSKNKFISKGITSTVLCIVVSIMNVTCLLANNLKDKESSFNHCVLQAAGSTQLILEASTYKKLNGLFTKPFPKDYDGQKAGIIETKAFTGPEFKAIVEGCSATKVLKLIGPPQFVTPISRKIDKQGHDHRKWLYFMGFRRLGIELEMMDKRCISARLLSWQEKKIRELTAFEEIRKFVIGKTEKEISTLLKRSSASLKFKDLPMPTAVALPHQTKFIRTAELGNDYAWTFYFDNNQCKEVTNSFIQH